MIFLRVYTYFYRVKDPSERGDAASVAEALESDLDMARAEVERAAREQRSLSAGPGGPGSEAALVLDGGTDPSYAAGTGSLTSVIPANSVLFTPPPRRYLSPAAAPPGAPPPGWTGRRVAA